MHLFIYAGNDFQLDTSTVCVLAVVNSNVSDCGSCFRINITEDSDSEPTEQFNISFTVISVQPEGVNINNFSEAIIYIRDDDGKSHYWTSLCEIIEGQHEQWSWHGFDPSNNHNIYIAAYH